MSGNTQIFIQKLRYLNNKTFKKYYDRDLPIQYKNIFVHDSVLAPNPENWKYSLNVIKHWQNKHPNNNFYYIIHYSPIAYKYYKDNPMVLFENTINTDDNDLDKITCFDTAHYVYKHAKEDPEYIMKFNINNLPLSDQFKLVHLNGLDGKKFEQNIEKHAYPNGKNDIIGYPLSQYQQELEKNGIQWIIE